MQNSLFIAAEKNEANRVLSYLLKKDLVRKDLRIRYDGESVMVPVKHGPLPKGYVAGSGYFEERGIPVSPVERIRKLMKVEGNHISIPSKFIRLGSSIIFKENRMPGWRELDLNIVANELGIKSIYVDFGIGRTVERRPDIRLIFGPGGDVVHEEGRVRYFLDPSRIMFSPGNVNIRQAVPVDDISGKTVLDMFAGIGYFSLQIAARYPDAKVYSCEINPVAYGYLEKNISTNSLERSLVPLFGDCRSVTDGIVADYIIMGHFDAMKFLSTALLRSKQGTMVDFHLLVDSNNIDTHWGEIITAASRFGYILDFVEQRVVKSYGPHMWHVSTTMKVSRIL